MGGILSAIIGVTKPKQKGPSAEELAEQKRLEEQAKKRAALARAKGIERTKVATARAAGPQTLFTREGQIPRAVNLGGGQRA
jgi:hypothetical protein